MRDQVEGMSETQLIDAMISDPNKQEELLAGLS
jgi:hypothetical protein